MMCKNKLMDPWYIYDYSLWDDDTQGCSVWESSLSVTSCHISVHI